MTNLTRAVMLMGLTYFLCSWYFLNVRQLPIKIDAKAPTGRLVARVTDKRNNIVIDGEVQIIAVHIVKLIPISKVDFRNNLALKLRIEKDGVIEWNSPINDFIKPKQRKKDKTAHIGFVYDDFQTLVIAVDDIENQTSFKIDILLEVVMQKKKE